MNEDELRSKINRMYSEADELEENAEKTQKCAAKMFSEAESARRRGMSDEECFDILAIGCIAVEFARTLPRRSVDEESICSYCLFCIELRGECLYAVPESP